MVECQLPKLNTRVRFPYPAPSGSKVRFTPTFFVHSPVKAAHQSDIGAVYRHQMVCGCFCFLSPDFGL